MGASANAVWADTGTVDVSLPTDKLKASLQRPDNNSEFEPVVLLNCGSFNPPTIMHLRMLDLGAQVMRKVIT